MSLKTCEKQICVCAEWAPFCAVVKGASTRLPPLFRPSAYHGRDAVDCRAYQVPRRRGSSLFQLADSHVLKVVCAARMVLKYQFGVQMQN